MSKNSVNQSPTADVLVPLDENHVFIYAFSLHYAPLFLFLLLVSRVPCLVRLIQRNVA